MNASLGTVGSLRVLCGYRRRLLEGVSHDVRQRYTGSVLGVLWAVFLPLLQLSLYAGLYTMVFKVRPAGLPEGGYVVLVFSGLVPLMAFNEALLAASSSLSSHRNLLLNTVFPAELIPLRAALSAQVTSLVGLVITLLVGVALGRTSWPAVLVVPLGWTLLLMFAVGIGWALSLLSLVARDVQHGLGFVMTLLFVLSPFAYTPEMVPGSLRLIMYVNPLSYFVLTFQQVICYGAWPTPVPACGAALLGIGGFLAGFWLFLRTKYVFFDYA